MANKKKAATTVVAVATAAALLLGGTFAWQSISQTALNEASDVINPGGRLHNDLWYVDAKTTNNDIYVENFAEDEIFARVRLSEYMEIVMNYGSAAEKVENVAGKKFEAGTDNEVTDAATAQNQYDYEYTTHYFHDVDGDPNTDTNATDKYWEWTTGSEDSVLPYYMPTFNLNKDSLAPDLNGLYRDRVGGISNREMGQYVDVDGNALEDYEGYSNGELLTGFEIYDGDTNSSDEIGTDPLVLADIIENGETSQYNDAAAVVLTDDVVEHEAKPVGATKGLVSIEEWLGWFDNGDGTYNYEKYENGDYGNYWVYDTDGWVYWSGAIGAGETTGLLLDSFTLKEVMDDTWYYAVEAEGEFVTADDLGEFETAATASTFNLRSTPVASETDLPYYEGGTGFYENGISKEALALLSIIGVDVYGEAEDEGEVDDARIVDLALCGDWFDEMTAGTLTWDSARKAYVYSGDAQEVFIRATNFRTTDGAVLDWDDVLDEKVVDLYHQFQITGIIAEERENVGNSRYWYCDADGNQIIESRIDDWNLFARFIRNEFAGEQEFSVVVKYKVDGVVYESDPIKIIMTGIKGQDTSAMTFTSSEELHDEGTTTPYIEIKKNRTDVVEWNLWNCSEGEFTLTSDNEDVSIEPYGGDESYQNIDMNIVIPTSVTEDFTVTAKAVNSDKTVVFTVVMKDNAALSYFSASYDGETDINHTVIVNEDYADKVDHSTEYALSVTAYDGDDNEISADYSVLLKSLEVTDGYVANIDGEENCVGNVKRDGYPHSAVSIYDGDLTIEALYDTLDEHEGDLLFNDDLTVTYTLEICDNNSDVTTEIYVTVNIDVIPPSLTLEEAREKISTSPVGTPVRIDNNDWYIIAKEGDNALLYHASAIVIDKEFDKDSNSWADSDMRAWLNGECLDSLTVLKQMAVEKTIYTANKYDRSGSYVETEDKVFFLSEADLFGTANGTETTEVKEYTMGTAEKVFPDGILGGSEYYWLRSPYDNDGGVATVLRGGPLFDSYSGGTVDCRPAIWITTAES